MLTASRGATSGEEVDAVVGVDACADLLRRCGSDDGLAARLEALRLRTELGAHEAALEDAAFVAADAAAPTKTRARASVGAARVHLARKDAPAAGAALAAAAAVDASIVRAKDYIALAAEVKALAAQP